MNERRLLTCFLACIICLSVIQPSAAEEEQNGMRSWSEWAGRVWLKKAGIPESEIQKTLADTQMMPMRDGTLLAADVYMPLIPFLKYPTVLIRTPYGKNDLAMLGEVLTLFGYVCVIQDMRGRHASEGDSLPFFADGWGLDPEGQMWDGYDSVEWIAQQSWSNGKVGMFGASALGIAANMAAAAGTPHLECAVVWVAASDLYHDAAHQGGGFRKALVDGWLADVGAVSEVLDLMLENETYNTFWHNASMVQRHSITRTPIYHLGGWYDIFLQGTLNHFAGLQTNGAGAARGNQKVIIGPWTHSGQAFSTQGQLNYPSNSIVEEEEIQRALDWFNYWLKGEQNTILDLPPVRYYLMGDVDDPEAPGNVWRSAESFPIPATPSALFLTSGGILQGATPAATDSALSFIYHPENPVPTLGGANLKLPAGPHDQRPLETRSDVLVYTTPVLTEPLEVVGRVKVRLLASSTALDTDWTARLCDVYPDGRSMLVTDGILRARYRDGFEESQLMQPGEIYEFEIDLWSTAIVFNAGHRICLIISSSNDPRFDPNPNTGEPLRKHTETVSAAQTIYHGAWHPSRLILPVTSPELHPLFRQGEDDIPGVRVY